MSALHLLPDFLVFPAVVVPLVLAVSAAPDVRRYFWPRKSQVRPSSELMDAFIALASSAAVLLTFSLVQAESVLRHIEDQNAKEAALLNDLDRTLARYGGESMLAMRPVVINYGQSIVSEEWPLLRDGGRSKSADQLFSVLSKSLTDVEPETHRQQALYTDALRLLDELSDLRDERIDAATVTLPATYWFTALAMIALMVVVASLNEPTTERTWITATIATAIGLLLALVVIFDAPFKGDGSIPSTPFVKAIEQMTARG